MIYNKQFTERVKRTFRNMSVSNPPAIDPRAMGMAYNILNKYQSDLHTSAVICLGVISHEFCNYFVDNNKRMSAHQVEQFLADEVRGALKSTANEPYKTFQALILLLLREEIQGGNIPYEMRDFLKKCDDIAIEYFSWYENKAIQAGILIKG